MSISDENNDLFKSEVPMTCLGLDIQASESIGIPIAAFAIIKHVEGGDTMYSLVGSEDLNDVETLGMLDFARMRFHHLLNQVMDSDGEAETQDDIEE